MWEGGLINALVMGMNHGLDHEENINKKKSMLMDYLMNHIKVSTSTTCKPQKLSEAQGLLHRT